MDIAKDGIALYQSEGSAPAPAERRPEQALAMATEYFEEWFPTAMRRYEFVKFGLEKGHLKETAFELHQATETLYHCVLLVSTFYTPHVHNLGFLRTQAERLDRRLVDGPANSGASARCSRSSRMPMKARYSKHYRITAEELTWLGERVEELGRAVHQVCSERIVLLHQGSRAE